MNLALKHYAIVTGGYWAFTLTDGAIRMLVVLYFHQMGYSPLEVALLFLFYEFFGVVTNLVGGWLAARLGLNTTMHVGMALQILALSLLTVPVTWLSVPYVMFAQALSGIAKDLNKMSAKASVKTLVPSGAGADSRLFKWVAALTGSKNALKGAGFFLGAMLLQWLQFQGALVVLAGGLTLVLILTMLTLPGGLGKSTAKPKFTQVFSQSKAINRLSAARFFLFAARDVWFVVAVPVFMASALGWSYMQVGTFMACWVIGYGMIQASAPGLLKKQQPHARSVSARNWVLVLFGVLLLINVALMQDLPAGFVLVTGLLIFGVVFAINSALHSYLILAYAEHDRVAMNVGFYYMANAGGRLAGTVLSGWSYQAFGLPGCLWLSAGCALAALILSMALPDER